MEDIMKKLLLTIGLFLLPAILFAQMAALTPEMVNPLMRYDPVSQCYIMPECKFDVNIPNKPLDGKPVRYLVINNLATLEGVNYGQDFYYDVISKVTRYADYTVGAPFSDATFNTYPFDDLEAIVVPLGDLPLNLATSGGVSLIGFLEQMLAAGKKVFIIGNRVLYHAFDSRASANTRVQFAQEFIENKLGVNFISDPSKPDFVSWTDGSTTTWVAYYMRGRDEQPFGSILIYCNWEYIGSEGGNKIYPLRKDIILHMDIFKIKQGSAYKPLVHWAGLSSASFRSDTLTGSTAEFGDARSAFVGIGVEYFCGDINRKYMLQFTLDWLMENVAEDGAQISFQTESLDFGIVKLGESVEIDLPITNIGNQPLTITEAFIEANSDNDEFKILKGEIKKSSPVTLNFQDTHRVVLRYTPVVDGESTGWIKVSSNSINSPSKLIWIKGLGGTGSGPKMELNFPSRVMDFGTVWTSSKELLLRVQNVGDVEMKIEKFEIDKNDDAAFGFPQSVAVPIYIKPGKEFPVNVRFALRPEPRAYKGNLHIQSDAILGNAEVNIELKARVGGSGPFIKTSTSKLDFGSVYTEEGSEKTFTLENTGKQELNISSIAIQGDYEGVYSITNGADLSTLAINESSEISVAFKPKEEKEYPASIYIASNAENDPKKVIELVGLGSLTSVWENPYSKTINFLKITPNPIAESAIINIRMAKEQDVELFLTDINGKIVKTLMNPTLISSEYTHNFSTNGLSSGTYFIVARSGNTSAAVKAVITK